VGRDAQEFLSRDDRVARLAIEARIVDRERASLRQLLGACHFGIAEAPRIVRHERHRYQACGANERVHERLLRRGEQAVQEVGGVQGSANAT